LPQNDDFFPFTFGCYRGCLYNDFVRGDCKANGTGFIAGYDPAATLRTPAVTARIKEVYKISYGRHSHGRPMGGRNGIFFIRGGDRSVCAGFVWDVQSIVLYLMMTGATTVICMAAARKYYIREEDEDGVWEVQLGKWMNRKLMQFETFVHTLTCGCLGHLHSLEDLLHLDDVDAVALPLPPLPTTGSYTHTTRAKAGSFINYPMLRRKRRALLERMRGNRAQKGKRAQKGERSRKQGGNRSSRTPMADGMDEDEDDLDADLEAAYSADSMEVCIGGADSMEVWQ
jgi:hypothetical protein